MAKKKYTKKKIQETKGGNFGKYDEGNGGGTPIGGIYGGGHGRGIWKKAGSPGHRESQPRTSDGKFTYNSVNGKTISTEESRGKTVNPLLTGGVNGIKIDDVEKEFANKSGAYWDKYKDKWYNKGGEIVLGAEGKTRVAADAIWEVAKRKYDEVEGEFKEESTVFSQVKSGRKSLDEKAAAQKAQKTGKETFVKDKTSGGIKIKPGTQIPLPKAKAPASSSVKPWKKVSTPSTGSTLPTSSGFTHSADELAQGRQTLINGGFDVSNLTDEQLDQLWDQIFE